MSSAAVPNGEIHWQLDRPTQTGRVAEPGNVGVANEADPYIRTRNGNSSVYDVRPRAPCFWHVFEVLD